MEEKHHRLIRFILIICVLSVTSYFGYTNPHLTDYELMTQHKIVPVLMTLLIVNEGVWVIREWKD